jgi:glycosyltransferase involved in cell wall biosynthesis
MRKKDNELVSVVVPCYNHGIFLGECLESVLAQTYKEWECIVVDNNSTDNTQEIIALFANKDPRIKSLFHEPGGVSGARNVGIRSSKGAFILPLDADDKIGPEYLEEAVQVLNSNPEVKIVYCNAMLFGEVSGLWDLPPFSIKNLHVENMVFCTAMFRKTDFDNSPGFSEEMDIGFEDWDFWLHFLKKDTDVCQIPKVLFYYRIRQASRNNLLEHSKQLLLRKRIYTRHQASYEQTLNIPELAFELSASNNALKNALSELKQANLILGKIRGSLPYQFYRKALNSFNFIKKKLKR